MTTANRQQVRLLNMTVGILRKFSGRDNGISMETREALNKAGILNKRSFLRKFVSPNLDRTRFDPGFEQS